MIDPNFTFVMGNLILLFILIFLFGILATIFWIWMFIDAIKRDFQNKNHKVIWVLVIAITQLIGAIIYFFIIKIGNKK